MWLNYISQGANNLNPLYSLMKDPKVLIINQPFNTNTGGGITLTNLVSGWEKENLAVVCSGYLLSDALDTRICATYYQLGSKERKWVFPLNFFKRKYSSGLVKFTANIAQKLTAAPSNLRVKFIMQHVYPFLEYLGVSHALSKTELSVDFCNWLDDYKPDVIYAQAHSREDILFCIQLINYLKKPAIFHMMDDWPSIVKNRGFLKSYWFKKIDCEFRSLLDRADFLMSISDYMADQYRIKFNKNFTTFHNPININFWKKNRRIDYALNRQPTILYAGRIGLGIGTSLETIADAIAQVNKDLNMSVKLILQTQQKPVWIDKHPHVIHAALLLYEDLPRVFSDADLLVLPYDFSSNATDYIKYSMPTKAPEYMASGTPIIVFAPNDTAISNYAIHENWASVVTENNTTQLYFAIRDLIVDENKRRILGQKAVFLAEKNHSSETVTEAFKGAIYSLVSITDIHKAV